MKLLQKDAISSTTASSTTPTPITSETTQPKSATHSAASPKSVSPHDKISFGMAINTASGCCVEKVKTGRKGGCCSHIEQKKFVGLYNDAVERETKEKGIKPKLDPEIKAILDAFAADLAKENLKTSNAGKVQTPQKLTSTPPLGTTHAVEPKEALWKRVLMTPVRFIQWLVIGFWQDVRLIFSGKRSS
jgi:hypothetical protein